MAEAVSFLLLLVAAIAKRNGGSDAAVSMLGPIHGVLYLAYVAGLLKIYGEYDWPFWRTVAGAFLGAVPLGGFWVDRNWLAPLQVAEAATQSETSAI